jgi:hypothetical protein
MQCYDLRGQLRQRRERSPHAAEDAALTSQRQLRRLRLRDHGIAYGRLICYAMPMHMPCLAYAFAYAYAYAYACAYAYAHAYAYAYAHAYAYAYAYAMLYAPPARSRRRRSGCSRG